MGKKLEIIQGDVFGRLTVIRSLPNIKKSRCFECVCICGKIVSVRIAYLTTGKTKSCGCLKSDTNKKAWTKHSRSKDRIYNVWAKMKARCLAKKGQRHYKYYAAKGITVCDEWLEFKSFLNWALNNGYNDSLTIERKDVSKGYNPENCKFIPQKLQPLNQDRSIKVKYNNELIDLKELSNRTGIKYGTIRSRYYRSLPLY